MSIVVDGPAGEVYGIYDFGEGPVETPHCSISAEQIAKLDVVEIFVDYRYPTYKWLGGEFDNIVVATAVVDSDGDGVPDDEDAFPDDPDESVDSDGDGVGDNKDENDNSDLRDSVVVGGFDTGVPNQVDAWGLSIQDYINGIEGYDYINHGQYVSTVVQFVEDLLYLGVITEDEADVMVSSAAHSDIGKKPKRNNKGGKKK
jgi:hypothetical protein